MSDKRQEQQTQKEFDSKMREIRHRLSEQLTCLDRRAEVEREQLQDFQEYFQSRAEIEKEYASRLERLHDKHARKRKIQTPSKEGEPQLTSSTQCWNAVLDMTKNHHKQHSILGNVYGNHLATRFSQLREGLDNVYRKSREMTVEVQQEIQHVITELFSTLKTYQNTHSESKRAMQKSKQMELEFKKAQEKGSTREKALEKQVEKNSVKAHEADLKATKARNDYLMTLAATNKTLEKYFNDDVTKIVECVDMGYLSQMKKALLAFLEAQNEIQKCRQEQLRKLEMQIRCVNAVGDKDMFISSNEQAFQLPSTFSFQPHAGDEVCEVCAQYPLENELHQKYENLRHRCEQRELEAVEIKKSLETVHSSMQDESVNLLLEDIQKQFHVLKGYLEPHTHDVSRSASLRRRIATQENELYYLEKFKEYMEKSNSQVRIKARKDILEGALKIDLSKQRSMRKVKESKKKQMKSKRKSVFSAKLFGGNLQQFLAMSDVEIPHVVESCIEFITLYGLDYEGIFRMPGSQTEVNEMKNAFEKGEDPLPDLGERGDIHLVASVLKAYFRELPEPLFPLSLTDEFLDCCKNPNAGEKISDLRRLVEEKLDTSIMIVMRYLFDFLKILSQHSDESMMDTHNLAVCFGPTLAWPPEGYDPVSSQSMIIDLVDTMILFTSEVFPQTPGVRYKESDNDVSPTGSLDPIPEIDGQDIEELNITAIAKSDYHAKCNDELSFRRGQSITLLYRINLNQWQGRIGNQQGLISNSHVNIPDMSSPDTPSSPSSASTVKSREYLDHLNSMLSSSDRPHSVHGLLGAPAIVTDHIVNNSPPTGPSTARVAPPPVRPKPKPIRPVPTVRRHAASNTSQTL